MKRTVEMSPSVEPATRVDPWVMKARRNKEKRLNSMLVQATSYLIGDQKLGVDIAR